MKFLTTKITKLQNFYLLLSLIHHGADTLDFQRKQEKKEQEKKSVNNKIDFFERCFIETRVI